MEKLNSITEKLKEHVRVPTILKREFLILKILNLKERHVKEVREATTNPSTELEEKIIQKHQKALNQRDEQLEKIKEKLREHVRSII